MKKITLIFMGMTLIISLLITSTALAWNCGPGRGWGGGGWCGCGPDNLSFSWLPNLTVEQSKKLATLQKKHIKETAALRTERATKNIELDQLLAQPRPKALPVFLTVRQ